MTEMCGRCRSHRDMQSLQGRVMPANGNSLVDKRNAVDSSVDQH